MKTIAFFNTRRGAGQTSLVYHLAWMLANLEYRVLAADLDPQASLSGMFLDEDRLEELWAGQGQKTIDENISPLFEGIGDIVESPYIEKVEDAEKIGLLVGQPSLSKRENELSAQWLSCLDGDERAFRVTTAFARLIERAGEVWDADLALIDVGPNLGAINRAALIASDYVVIPLAPGLFSLQGLRSVGPALMDWRDEWKERLEKKPKNPDVTLPAGEMEPIGYVIVWHTVRLDRPVTAYGRWINQIPEEYKISVIGSSDVSSPSVSNDKNCLADLKNYYFLKSLAQEVNKPMFMLKPADGAIGAQQSAVHDCYRDFKALAEEILRRIQLEEVGAAVSSASA